MKAKFFTEQQPVKYIETNGKYYIFICLNGEHGTDNMEDGLNHSEQTYIEYDYNEIISNVEDIDIDDVQANPENYLDYISSFNSPEPTIKEIFDILTGVIA